MTANDKDFEIEPGRAGETLFGCLPVNPIDMSLGARGGAAWHCRSDRLSKPKDCNPISQLDAKKWWKVGASF
jgi:hypothetical protein